MDAYLEQNIGQNTSQLSQDSQLLSPRRKFLFFLENLEESNHYLIILAIHWFRLSSVIIHLLIAYLLVEKEPASIFIRKTFDNFYQIQNLYKFFQAVIYCSKIIQIFAIIVVVRKQNSSILFKFGVKIAKNITIISEIDLLLSGLILFVNLTENMPGFVITFAIHIIVNIFVQNYTNRRVQSYVASQIGSIIWKITQVGIIFANAIAANHRDPLYFYLLNLLAGGIVFLWYKEVGFRIYIHSRPKYITMMHVSIYLTIITLFFEKFYHSVDLFAMIGVSKFIIVFLFMFIYWTLESRRNYINFLSFQSQSLENFDVKSIDLKSLHLFSNSANCQDVNCMFVGIFKLHKRDLCGNLKCYTHYQHYYDSCLKQKILLTEGINEKQSLLRFFMKCLYQRALEMSNGRNKKLLLDFCEFMVSQNFDLYKLCKLFREIECYPLNIFEAVRYQKIRIATCEEGKKLNKMVFEGRMEIEMMLTAEDTFQSICKNIDEYLLNNGQIWMQIERQQVNITHLRAKISSNFDLLDEVKGQWGQLTNYLNLQRRWRILYLNYSLFILNERVRQKDLQDSDLTAEQQVNISRYFDEQTKSDLLYDRSLLFDQNSMYLHTNMQGNKMHLIRASKYFHIVTGYTQQELKGAEVSELLNEDLKEHHDKDVLAWLQSGQSNNEAHYKIYFTEIKNKDNSLLPVTKHFKIIVDIHAQRDYFLQFVCLLKPNTKDIGLGLVESSIKDKQGLMTSNIMGCQFLERQARNVTRVQKNPFIKEDNLKPRVNMQGLTLIKRTIRLLIFFLILMNVSLSLLISQSSNILSEYVDQYINLLILYRFPYAFGKNVIKNGMNIGNPAKVVSQIAYTISQIQHSMNNELTTKALFSHVINPPRMYYPYRNDSFNEGIGYNEIDLAYFMMSNMETLKLLPVNLASESFQNFDSYLTPAFDNLLNSTKNNFHQQFMDFFSKMKQNQLIIIYAETFISILVIGYVGYTIKQYFRKMKTNLEIIVQFNSIQVKKIHNYWKNLLLYCQNINGLYYGVENERKSLNVSEFKLSNRFSRGSDDNDENLEPTISLNKKSKRIHENNSSRRHNRRIIIMVVLCMLGLFGSAIGVQLISVFNLSQIHQFQQAGFNFIRYFPATSILGYGVQQRYYYQLNPTLPAFNSDRYQPSLLDIIQIGRYSYIGNINFPDSQYFQDQKNYLFGNPCTYNSLPLNGTDQNVSKCLTIYSNTFSQGITTFLRACEQQVSDLLNGNINLTSTQVNQIANGFNLASSYITDAILTWSYEFSAMINNLDDSTTLLCILVSICLVIIYAILGEWVLLPKLTQDYAFMRRVFEYMVPECILINEKVIKQKFIINQMLTKE